MVYPTEEEAQYPEELCRKYAEGSATVLRLDEHVGVALHQFRRDNIEAELAKYHRCADADLRRKMAFEVMALEDKCVHGQEKAHLEELLRRGHYRGTDIRLALEHHGQKNLLPYPAGRWLWREVLSFRWKADAHINVLEAQALFTHARRILRDPTARGCRILVVIDSQVLYYALGKGRSPSLQLNRILRRLMALLQLFPVWTISPWNWADKPSRK